MFTFSPPDTTEQPQIALPFLALSFQGKEPQILVESRLRTWAEGGLGGPRAGSLRDPSCTLGESDAVVADFC